MTLREILNVVFLFLLYLSLQILIVRNLVLFDVAFCFVYVACILLLPTEMSLSATLLTAFGVGIVVDTFYNTLGMHAAATVMMAYVRPVVVRVQAAQRGFDSRTAFSIREMGSRNFFYYVLVLTFIHHFALFLIEANNILLFLPAMVKILASTLFTSVTIMLVQYFSRN
ncbi:rod shape-determining protein MreD [Larkinella harenae]